MDNTAVIILAGGQGTRFGSKKQFLQFQNKELWRHIYDKINKYVKKDNIVVVGVDIEGGTTRSFSVINGLIYFKELQKDFDRIVILEAARPLITSDQLESILKSKEKSVTYAMPLVSTIISKDGSYLERGDYFKLSTPVSFDYALFSNAYLSNKYTDVTDDTRVMYEEYGIKPTFLEGSDNMLKLTYPSDLFVLEKLAGKYNL